MRCITSGKYFKTLQVWFESHSSTNEFREHTDSIVLHDNPSPFRESKFTTCSPFLSLISDISDVDQWLKGITKNYAYEIRRAKNENVNICFYNSEDIKYNPTILNEFNNVYTSMYEQKNLEGHELPIRQIQDYAEHGAMMISSAKVDEANIFHSYIVGEDSVRLLHSCSLFRGYDNKLRNAMARANKLLHYKDVEYFSSKGKRRYDWGGVTSFDEPNGIDKFKMAFGGVKICYYSVTIRKSPRAKIFAVLYRNK